MFNHSEEFQNDLRAIISSFPGTRERTRALAELVYRKHRLSPTTTQIRDWLGTGSYTTIKQALEDWRKTPPDARPMTNNAGIPDALASKAGELIASMWQLSTSEAQSQLDAERRVLAQHAQELHEQIESITDETKRLEGLLGTADGEVLRLGSECQKRSEQIDDLRGQVRELETELTRTLATHEQIVSDLQQQLANQSTQYASQIEALKREHAEASQAARIEHDGKVAEFQGKVERLTASLAASEEGATRLRLEVMREVDRNKASEKELSAIKGELRETRRSLEIEQRKVTSLQNTAEREIQVERSRREMVEQERDRLIDLLNALKSNKEAD